MTHPSPAPIWPHRTRAAPSRPAVSEEAVTDAAAGLLDEEGLDAVTMRRVAQRLGVTAPSVYWHVVSKDGLLNRLYDYLCSEVPTPLPGRWDDRLRSLANGIRSVFAAHRDAARIAVGRFPLGPHGLRITEAALAAFADAGLNAEEAAYSAHLFFGYVTSFSYQETVLPGPTPARDRADALQRLERYLTSLPPEDYPHIARCAIPLSRPGLDRRFAFGLDHLIRGLTAP